MPAPRRSRTAAAATPEREEHVLFSLYVLKHISTTDITRHIFKYIEENSAPEAKDLPTKMFPSCLPRPTEPDLREAEGKRETKISKLF